MSLVTKYNRITVGPFAAVPALLDLPAIQRAAPSVSDVSSFQGTTNVNGGGVELAEGCFLTKSINYTHQLTHWVDAVGGEDSSQVQEVIDRLGIITYGGFNVNDPCNLVYLEASVQKSLDLFFFIAITASSSTLNDLIEMVRSDNDRVQQSWDAGIKSVRSLDFSLSSFVDPEYELVALHPEHFLPDGCILTVYNPAAESHKNYVAATDRCLRESIEPNSLRFPAFQHQNKDRIQQDRLNVFLVVLDAEMKFQRYFKMIQSDPPATPLPDDVLTLMRRTIELVELLYWTPELRKGSGGQTTLDEEIANT